MNRSKQNKGKRQILLRSFLYVLIILVVNEFSFNKSNTEKQRLYSEKEAQILPDISMRNISLADENFINFAVIGFSKCGTTYLLQHVLNTSQIYWGNKDGGLPREIHDLRKGRIKEFNQKYEGHLNKKTIDGHRVFNGFKSPEVLQSESFLLNMETHFPKTDFIVSIRHPILHFQSLYNFKFLRHGSKKSPNPNQLIGECDHDCTSQCKVIMKHRVCTGISKFHEGLSRLNFTEMTSDELDLLGHHNRSIHGKLTGRVFLMELGQMSDRTNRRESLQRDLENFLKLEPKSIQFPELGGKRNKYLFDICEDRFRHVRGALLEIGKNASRWIQEYFIKSPRTVVSNKDHFLELVEAWKYDPCKGKTYSY